jgi:hypothetical protein
VLGAAAVTLAHSASLSAQAPRQFARLAPYPDIIWPDSTPDRPSVLIGRDWLELTSVDGASVADIVAFSRQTFGSDWQRRFDEDLVEVLGGMNRAVGESVALGLRNRTTGQAMTLTMQMTPANRQALLCARRTRAGDPRFCGSGAPSSPTPGTSATAGTPGGARRPTSSTLTAAEVARDLDALQREMETRWAYLKTNNVDYRAAIDGVRERAPNGMDPVAYSLEVRRILALFIDGHAIAGGVSYPLSASRLPVHIEPTNGRYVAVRLDRTGLVDPDYPYLVGIDGRPLADWLAAVRPYVAKASPQWMEKNSIDVMRNLGFARALMGIRDPGPARLELASPDGGRTRAVELSDAGGVSRRFAASAILDGNVGYLRLTTMDDRAAFDVDQWMPRFRDTKGLIVDVRGNGGGTRDALRALFPYLMSESDVPRVVNTAKYRLHPEYAEDHLGGSRFMYRETWDGWTPEERAAIARFKTTFTPQWTPPEAEFSDWHYLVMSRRTNPRAFVYGKPVVVLMDAGSFSATDIFVNALKGWHDVTLVGTPSGGGSARQVTVTLPVSQISFSLASMASFQWTGRLYDGNGTQPDILVHPDPEAFLIGGRDNVLERALQILR